MTRRSISPCGLSSLVLLVSKPLLTKQEFDKIFKDIKENGRYGKIQSIQERIVGNDKFYQFGNTLDTTKSSIDSMATQHSRENTKVFQVDSGEYERGETPSNGKTNNASFFKSEQGIETQEQRRYTDLTSKVNLALQLVEPCLACF